MEWDESVRGRLSLTLQDMRDKLWEFEDYGWMVDFSTSSVANMALRKTDTVNFAAANEGNLYNNLFFKVMSKTTHDLNMTGILI